MPPREIKWPYLGVARRNSLRATPDSRGPFPAVSFVWWKGYGVSYRPPEGNTLTNRYSRYPEFFRPCREALGPPVVLDDDICPTIPALLFMSSPSAIPRFVVSVIVDAVQGCALWSWPHVVAKCLKRRAPSVAHHNATTTIVAVLRVLFSVAAISHSFPASKFRRIRTAMSSCRFSVGTRLALHRPSAVKVRGSNGSLLAARTPTQPPSFGGCIFNKPKNSPFPEGLARQVFEVVGATNRMIVRHAKSPSQVSCVQAQAELRIPSGLLYCSNSSMGGLSHAV